MKFPHTPEPKTPRLPAWLLPHRRPAFLGLLLAVVLVLLSTVARLFFAEYVRQLLFFTYLPAVIAAGWFGGFWPGMLATLLSAACVDYFLAGQPFSFSFRTIDLIRIIVFTGVGILISALNGSLHYFLRRESEHASNLEQMVADRTAELRMHIADLEEFSYTVSHDLRSPLRAMQGYANAVLEDYSEQIGPNGQAYLQQIIKAAKRMDFLTRDVLAYSQLSRESVSLRAVNIEDLVRDILDQYPSVKNSNAEVVVRRPLLPLLGNESLLTQAIGNLVANAVKFVPAGKVPRLEFWTEKRPGSKVRLLLKDNGIGIRPEHQARIFGLFERVHPKGEFEGTGIGLAIVRKAVERMGGTVGVESDGVNGSTFWIELAGAEA